MLMSVAVPVAGMLAAGVQHAKAVSGVTWDIGNGNWDTTASSWASSATYANGTNVTFGSGSFGSALVNVDAGAVTPANFTVNNANTAYTFTGSSITASGTGTFDTPLTIDNSLTIDGAVTFLAPTTSTASTAALNIASSGGSVTFAWASGTITQSENSTYSGNLIITGRGSHQFQQWARLQERRHSGRRRQWKLGLQWYRANPVSTHRR